MPDPSSEAVTRSHSPARRVLLERNRSLLDHLWRVQKTAFGGAAEGPVFFSYAPRTSLVRAAPPNKPKYFIASTARGYLE
eukprot:1184838-Pleurochrysis_carterae.AAC.1